MLTGLQPWKGQVSDRAGAWTRQELNEPLTRDKAAKKIPEPIYAIPTEGYGVLS